ncbi:MAG TPA: CydX/CbdX family cytochrome bd oxidase small subunit [Candidatus Aphodousia faecipullorum]|nr:CydX/CbdX family cytochrome bd oxidase small subunit [Candidatus Aphodousia faecipullorum]
MFYIYWITGLLLAIAFAVLMGAMYEIKQDNHHR